VTASDIAAADRVASVQRVVVQHPVCMAVKPIFVFSVSRSGSTLVQRVIGAHKGVATVSEPWLLLPQLYAFRPRGAQAEYVHPLMVRALNEFCARLPNGREDYRRALHDFVLRLYSTASGPDATHFLDKTPPYCLISEDIMQLFPEGRFVFLWRNPLSIIASTIEAFERWHPTMASNDLFIGLPRLVDAYLANRDRASSTRFEDLTGGDIAPWEQMITGLDLKFERDALQRFAEVTLDGRMGDMTGVNDYSTVSSEPNRKWRTILSNPLRVEWSRRYLRFLGENRLAVMGYDLATLLADLDSIPLGTTSLLGDTARTVRDLAREPIRVRIRRHSLPGPNVVRQLLGKTSAG
jgi:hypothetical protein